MTTKEDKKTIDVAERLIQLRTERMVSQDVLAEAIGVSKSTYFRMERDANFSAEVLRRLLEYYKLTYEQFYNVKLPVEKYVTYPQSMLTDLRDAIEKYGKDPVSAIWGQNRERYLKLKEALDPVLEQRNKQIELPNFKNKEMKAGQTVTTIKFDAYAEWLIQQAMVAQEKLINAICG